MAPNTASNGRALREPIRVREQVSLETRTGNAPRCFGRVALEPSKNGVLGLAGDGGDPRRHLLEREPFRDGHGNRLNSSNDQVVQKCFPLGADLEGVTPGANAPIVAAHPGVDAEEERATNEATRHQRVGDL